MRVLYHEATFLESEAQLARKTKHSTAKEAARIARDAGVEALILGHFSTRYKDISRFAEEARSVFQNVLLADDGRQFEF
jgi:ribonuclease Z